MKIITLTSDWNSADYYVGAVKGRILSQCVDAVVVDVNHQVSSYNINQAAFVIKNSYKHFPKGSIHIIAVNSESSKDKPLVLVKFDGHFFISADNGIFHLFMDGIPEVIIEINNQDKVGSFPEKNVFADTAAKLANGTPPGDIGLKKEKLFRRIPMQAAIEESVIIGQVVYIDSYQNVITNVTKDLFEQVGKNRPFTIYVQSKSNKITKINESYNQTIEGELLAIFNSASHLEIAIRNGKAAELFNLTTNSSIRVVFDEEPQNKEKLQGSLF